MFLRFTFCFPQHRQRYAFAPHHSRLNLLYGHICIVGRQICRRVFRLWKFRTMRGGPGTDAERLTRAGRFLRRTSLDELPQLFHVLSGKMALVGPRPLPARYLPRYTPEQARRHAVRPGITGWAQVNGRNALSWEEKFRLDVWYVDHRSLALDLRILWRTLLKTVRPSGIDHADGETMPEFTG